MSCKWQHFDDKQFTVLVPINSQVYFFSLNQAVTQVYYTEVEWRLLFLEGYIILLINLIYKTLRDDFTKQLRLHKTNTQTWFKRLRIALCKFNSELIFGRVCAITDLHNSLHKHMQINPIHS